jgi:hypothetical protein
MTTVETRRTVAACIVAAALAYDAAPAWASPCGEQITAFETAVRQSNGKPDAGPFLRQSVGAQMARQPTPNSIKRAQAQAQSSFDAAVARAKELDTRGDQAGCVNALGAAKDMYNLQ